MTPIPATRAATLAAILVGLLAGMILVGVAAPGTARAETTPGLVTISGLNPTVPTPESRLTITGRVANANIDYDLTEVSVRVTISAFALPSREAIDEVVSGSNAYDGYAISSTTTRVADRLRPGKGRDFTIRTKMEQIPLPGPGVYVLGVEMIGVDPRLGFTVLGVDRTLLPWVPEAPEASIDLGWMWPLSALPGTTPDGVLLGDSTPRAIADRGRLDNLLSAGLTARKEVSWIIDPALTEVVDSMRSGYLVAEGDDLIPGTEERAAASWLEEVTSLADRTTVWTLPYADIDADSLQRGGLDRDVVRAISIAGPVARATIGSTGAGTVYWAPGGRITEATTALLASTGVSAVILREEAYPPVVDPGITPSGLIDLDTQFGRLRAILIDSGLRAALAMPDGTVAERLQARQRFISETAFIALESPPQARTVIAGSGNPRWDVNPRLLREILAGVRLAPWVGMVPLETLLTKPASGVPRTGTPIGPTQRQRELDPEFVAQIAQAQDSLVVLRDVVTNPIDITEPIAEALLRSGSAAWRTNPNMGQELIDIIQDDLDTDSAKVTVVSRGTVTFSGDTGRIPITVANDFDRSVTVGLRVVGSPAARLQSDPLEPVVIESGRRASLEVPVRIIGGDPLPVTIHLITTEGEDFGDTAQIQLQTTAYSRAALWVSVGAAVILVLLVIADGVRRARARRREQLVTDEAKDGATDE